jgi:putative phosphoribosyl transferase
MSSRGTTTIYELPELRERAPVFRDRADAGRVLAEMLVEFCGSGAIVLAIPAGGVPVGAEIARRLGLALDVAVVSKILLPWTTEAGYGAVAFDGTPWVNSDVVLRHRLDAEQVEAATRRALDKVERRLRRFRGPRPLPAVEGATLILVDDGIAAGSTMRVALDALRRQGAGRVVVAVPTGHAQSVVEIARQADSLYCANVRGGWSFAVADAYENWDDVDEDEVARILDAFTDCPEGVVSRRSPSRTA